MDKAAFTRIEDNYQKALTEEKEVIKNNNEKALAEGKPLTKSKPSKSWCLTKRLELLCKEINEKLAILRGQREEASDDETGMKPSPPTQFLDIDATAARLLLDKMNNLLERRTSCALSDAETMAAINGKM